MNASRSASVRDVTRLERYAGIALAVAIGVWLALLILSRLG